MSDFQQRLQELIAHRRARDEEETRIYGERMRICIESLADAVTVLEEAKVQLGAGFETRWALEKTEDDENFRERWISDATEGLMMGLFHPKLCPCVRHPYCFGFKVNISHYEDGRTTGFITSGGFPLESDDSLHLIDLVEHLAGRLVSKETGNQIYTGSLPPKGLTEVYERAILRFYAEASEPAKTGTH